MKYFSFLILFLVLQSNRIFCQKNIELYSQGMESFNHKNYSEALKYFEKYILKDEIDEQLLSSAQVYIGESLLGLEQKDGAISQYEKFITEYPTSNFRELALYRLGNLYFEKKLFEKSRTNLVELIHSYPASEYSGSAYHLIGETFIEENDLDKAENFFNSAVDSERNNTLVDKSIYSLANLYEKKGQYLDAVKYYDKLLGFHKDSELAGLAQLRIGVCYFYLKEYDNTVLELSDPLIKELDVDKQNEADYILANAFYQLREYKSATEAYRRILNNSPNSEMLDRIRYGLAWIHFQEGNYNDAYKLFYLLSQSPDDSVAIKSLYWSGEAKRYEGKFGESIEIHKSFVEKYPDHHYSDKVRLNIGISKFSQNSYSESEETLLNSINSTDPITKVKAFTLLGELKLRKKEYKQATEYFKRGLLIPQIPVELKDRSYLGLGTAYFFNKNNIEALNNLNSINENETVVDKNKLRFYKAESNFFLGNYKQAIESYENIQTDDNIIIKNTIYGKAYSYFNQKDLNKAAYYFNEYIKKYDGDEKITECQLRLADCYYGTKSYSQASIYYERALVKSQQFRNDDRSFFNFAQSLFKDGKITKAVATLNNLQTNFPASKFADDSQYLIGWIYFQNGNFDEAIINYTKLFSNYAQSPLLPIAYYSIGDSYFNKGEYERAIDSYNLLIERYPNSSYVYDAVNGIQYCYIVQDEQDKAINYLDSFIRNNGDSEYLDKVQFKKGEIYYSSGNYLSAMSEYQKVIDEYSKSSLVPSAYYWMGKSAVLLNKDNMAIGYFEKVIDSSLNSEVGFNSVIELGNIYRKQKNYEREVSLYDEIIPQINDSKNISEIKYIKSLSFIENNNIASAYQTLNEIVDKRDGSLFFYKSEIELGILELSRSNYESSLYLLNDVVNNREDDLAAKAQYYIGLNYYEQERMPEAITELIKVRSLYSAYDEWYSRGLMLLGDCYVKINDKENAAEMYKGVLKRHRNDELASEAKSKLERL